VPVRSAILGTVFALMIVTSTITFGASLRTLVAKPALYGWNWTYEMNGGGGLGDIPAKGAAQLLDADKYVASWSGVYFGRLHIDGQNTTVMGANPHARVGPPILSGHGFDATNQIVLGPPRSTPCTGKSVRRSRSAPAVPRRRFASWAWRRSRQSA